MTRDRGEEAPGREMRGAGIAWLLLLPRCLVLGAQRYGDRLREKLATLRLLGTTVSLTCTRTSRWQRLQRD